ncbi:hypothetical protein [Acetobacterium bakii]|uniref:Uncharacterized protein n=1 Tax=Acetobacterium bakii TaxID=52689 RepID=A0A0L6TVV8_9FIRM|nr:hypothetical protein [Acetobacterium bakii]KNZ40212.1 hypothetical protein AKG39_18860 [Acetobacterium bakii]
MNSTLGMKVSLHPQGINRSPAAGQDLIILCRCFFAIKTFGRAAYDHLDCGGGVQKGARMDA